MALLSKPSPNVNAMLAMLCSYIIFTIQLHHIYCMYHRTYLAFCRHITSFCKFLHKSVCLHYTFCITMSMCTQKLTRKESWLSATL